MSDRSPITDALATLGMIHFKQENRDAIHLAVEPVEAAHNLNPVATADQCPGWHRSPSTPAISPIDCASLRRNDSARPS